MATYYVWSGAGGTNAGTSWTNAYTAFASAVTAATVDGDVIKVHVSHIDSLGASVIYAFSASVAVICVDKDNSDALAEMDGTTGYIGSSASSYPIDLRGGAGNTVYMRGMAYRIAGSGNARITLCGNADGESLILEKCYLWGGTTSSTGGIALGSNLERGSNIILRDCTFRFGATTEGFATGDAGVEIYGGSISSSGAAPAVLFEYLEHGPTVYVEGCDLSHVTGTLVGDAGSAGRHHVEFVNCKFGSGVVVLAAQTGGTKGSATATVYNCASGDTHYQFGYYDAFGACVAYTSIYAADGPTYDGTNAFSWRIDTTASASFYTPFVTPWISTYHNGTSAITPRLEILRDGSATAYNDNEVWGEFSYQGTSGVPISTIVNDRMALLGTPAAQTTGMGTGSWTGEGGTAWSGKVNATATITPAEIGELKARVCVGLASATVYVDPQIRTA